MKRSIKKQMTAVFVGLTVCLLFALIVLNIRFLEPYYISNKESEFVNMYEKLAESVHSGTWKSEDTQTELRHMAEKGNLSYLLMNVETKEGIFNVPDIDMLNDQLTGYLLGQAQKESKVLESARDYQIAQYKDPRTQTEYIVLWGAIDGTYNTFLRSPLESIKESVAVSNRFLLYIGGAVTCICICLVWYFSKRLTDPIKELALLSDKMADLDFNAKYKSGGENEIGELGANFNRMSEKLESTILELKSANNSLQKDIERKEKLEQMRSDFLGNVSHELKTPIALIQGYAEGLKEGVSDDAESREFYCDVIMDEAGKMNQMVRNLLTLNQLEFGDEDIQFERFDVTELIQGVLQSMEIMAQQKEARVNFIQEAPVYVWADELKVEQVVRNYVSNAFHHLDGDNVVEVKITVTDEKARISVFNTGAPIPQEDIAHIWDKFYKVDKAHTREYGGNGIGLSIVKAIMESFHQKYGLNNYDNGVEFWFELDVK